LTAENWRAICEQAKRALSNGQRHEARRLAHRAAALAPHQEEPWLVLAAIATPRASIGYLRKAIEINPNSSRAKKGLEWAEKRATKSDSPPAHNEHSETLALPRLSNWIFLSLLVLAASFATFALVRPPEVDDGLRFIGAAAAHEIDALLASDTPTSTATPSASPTPTSTLTSTNTPTITPTDRPSATPTATTQTNPAALTKFKVEPPDELKIEDGEWWIDINLSEQKLAVYDGEDLVESFLVSTGRGGTPTVTGEFRVWAKVRIQDMSGPGYYVRDVPWVMYFYKSYGIHGTWWHNNFGTPMSAGCVNMTIEAAEWMYSWVQVGTVIKVHY
jgi:lipoprotein-anchoring transpeptidase ErfK/SrfK